MRLTLCYIITAVFTSILLTSCTTYKYSETAKYQQELWEHYHNTETTPVKEDEREGFKGITFFPISENYVVHSKFTRLKDGEVRPFPTSAGRTQYYREYGQLSFTINSKPLELIIYMPDPPPEDEYLFLPFMDETNGYSSYGGGRYMDFELKEIKNETLTIDFNKAYNPYCAYSKYYNCPIPPADNYLGVEINAGVSYTE